MRNLKEDINFLNENGYEDLEVLSEGIKSNFKAGIIDGNLKAVRKYPYDTDQFDNHIGKNTARTMYPTSKEVRNGNISDDGFRERGRFKKDKDKKDTGIGYKIGKCLVI